jgi:SAM-dependent methyltransferase
MNFTCQICASNGQHKIYHCREQMFGWGDKFTYFQCAGCGCLQIAAVPADLARFYPATYNSYHSQMVPQQDWKSRLAARRDFSMATATGFSGRMINRFMPARPDLSALAHVPARQQMRILDVGCGSGALLNFLQRAGFESLAGIDPFLPEDVQVSPKVSVRKLRLDQVQEQFDLIMFHHVFEHVESGQETLRLCGQRLTAQGKILLRIPTADSDAWEQYRENWVQLDAPRHLFLHTRNSLGLLAKKAGMKVEKWLCDSTTFQFWGSELYRRNQPLFDGNGVATIPENHFSKAELKTFAARTKKANAQQRGDQVVAVLSRALL